jgi:integrase/recombinase XerD
MKSMAEKIIISASKQEIIHQLDLNEEYKKAIAGFIQKQESDHTKKSYYADLLSLFDMFPISDLRRFERNHIIVFKNALKTRYSTATTARRISTVRSFFQWLLELELIDRDPSILVKPPKQDSLEGKTPGLSDAEVRTILSIPKNVRDQTILEILLHTAVRNAELRHLRVKNITTEGAHHIMAVRGKGNKVRRIPLQSRVVFALAAYAEAYPKKFSNPDAFLFTPMRNNRTREKDKALSDVGLLGIFKKYAKKAGVKNRVCVHSTRVTSVSNSLERGATDTEVCNLTGWRTKDMVTRYNRRNDTIRTNAAHRISF